MPYTGEVDRLGIPAPYECIYIRIESFTYKTFLARLQVHDEEAVLVSFVTVALHAL